MIYILNFIHLISMHKRYLHSFFSLVFYFNIELLFLHHRICFCLLVLVKLSTTTKRIPTNNQPTTQQKQQRKKNWNWKRLTSIFPSWTDKSRHCVDGKLFRQNVSVAAITALMDVLVWIAVHICLIILIIITIIYVFLACGTFKTWFLSMKLKSARYFFFLFTRSIEHSIFCSFEMYTIQL